MEFIKPQPDLFLLPAGTREVVMHAPVGRPEVRDVDTLITPNGVTVLQLRVDESELELLKKGVPVTLMLHQTPMCPVSVGVGGFDLTNGDDKGRF